MKEMKTTAQVLVDCLEAEGVDVMFGIPGEETLDLMFAIRDSKIRFIPVRHEQGAAFMADVYGRLTGRAGVCLSTLGPGATNLVTGVADAYLDGAPLVAITGQVGTDRMQLTSHQYLDLTAMFEPITKRSKQIIRPDTVGEIVRLAFKHAEKGKPGATHIDLPQNIAKMPADAVPLKRQQMHEVYADPTHIAAAGKIISEAKNPVILAGAGAVRGHAAAAVTELADRLHIPVVNTMMAKGIIPMDDKYSLWTIGIPQKDYVNQLFDRADVVIAIGYDIVECAPAKWGARENMTIVHIDSAPADVNKRYQPAVEVVGDILESLYEILRCAHRTGEPEFALALRQTMVAEHEAMAADDSCPMKPARILADVRKVMGRDDIVVSDVGAHKMWIARHYDCYEPNTCLISNGFASMGFSIPGAFAAKLLYPEKKVLAVCGDGGFMMNSQELETAVREHVPFVTLIWEDSSYGLIKWKEQEQFGGEHCYVDFSNPDFKLLAEAMRCKGYRVEKAEELTPTLEEAFKQDVYTPEYATGFKILGADKAASTLIQVSNPWQGAKDVKVSYFISRNGEQAPAGFNGPTIPAGAKRIVCMASSYIAMFDALGQVDKIVGVSGIDYVSNPYILAHKNSIKDMGPEMNYELLLGLKPDVVLLYGIGDAQTAVTDKLKELFIPYMYVGEYLEESPLGKAEWLVALSELTDSRKKGIEIFREIPKRYQVLKALTESVEQRPTVMLNTPWNDSWVMPSTKSYMAQLVADAGAEYIYKENSSNSSTPIGLETAYGLIQKADYWINVGSATSLDELKTVNPKFADAKAVRERTVYNNNLRLTPTGGNDYWESAVVRPDMVLRDLIHIFHPELVPDSLYYYRHLE